MQYKNNEEKMLAIKNVQLCMGLHKDYQGGLGKYFFHFLSIKLWKGIKYFLEWIKQVSCGETQVT